MSLPLFASISRVIWRDALRQNNWHQLLFSTSASPDMRTGPLLISEHLTLGLLWKTKQHVFESVSHELEENCPWGFGEGEQHAEEAAERQQGYNWRREGVNLMP